MAQRRRWIQFCRLQQCCRAWEASGTDQVSIMSDLRRYIGPFTNNAAFRLYHNHRLDPATKGRHIIRLPDRTLAWSDEYEQRLRKYEAKAAAPPSDRTGSDDTQRPMFLRVEFPDKQDSG